jgi:hypothetical protein
LEKKEKGTGRWKSLEQRSNCTLLHRLSSIEILWEQESNCCSSRPLISVADKTSTNGKPDYERNGDDDSQDNQLHFHVLEPHLTPKLFALPLVNISLKETPPPPGTPQTSVTAKNQSHD